ncbi:hypothetical protein [Cellulomonas sp. P5_C6]
MAVVNISDGLAQRATAQAQENFAGSLDGLVEVAVAFYLQVQQAVHQATAKPAGKGQVTKAQVHVAADALYAAGHLDAKELAAVKADPGAVAAPGPHAVIKGATKENIKATIAAGKATVAARVPAAGEPAPGGPGPGLKGDIGPNIGALKDALAMDPVEASAQAIAASGIPAGDIAAYLAQIQRVAARVVQLSG